MHVGLAARPVDGVDDVQNLREDSVDLLVGGVEEGEVPVVEGIQEFVLAHLSGRGHRGDDMPDSEAESSKMLNMFKTTMDHAELSMQKGEVNYYTSRRKKNAHAHTTHAHAHTTRAHSRARGHTQRNTHNITNTHEHTRTVGYGVDRPRQQRLLCR